MTEFSSLSRRRFLQTSAVVAAGSSLPMGSTWANDRTTALNGSFRVGVILPTSDRHPALADDFIIGLQAYFQASQHTPPSWLIQTDLTSTPAFADVAGHLVTQGGADALVGLVGPRRVPALADRLQAHHTLLVASHLGANLPRIEHQRPFVVDNSLGYWQTAYALGTWAAQELGSRALIVTDGYESGYDALAAFRVALAENGGQVVALHLQDLHTPDDLATILANDRPDFAYLALPALAAIPDDLLAALGTLPLVSNPLVGLGYTADFPTLEHPALANMPADAPPFTRLGYQAALHLDAFRTKGLTAPTAQDLSGSIMLRDARGPLHELPRVVVPHAAATIRAFGMQSACLNTYLTAF